MRLMDCRGIKVQEKDSRVAFFVTVGRGMRHFAVEELKKKLGRFQVRVVVEDCWILESTYMLVAEGDGRETSFRPLVGQPDFTHR